MTTSSSSSSLHTPPSSGGVGGGACHSILATVGKKTLGQVEIFMAAPPPLRHCQLPAAAALATAAKGDEKERAAAARRMRSLRAQRRAERSEVNT